MKRRWLFLALLGLCSPVRGQNATLEIRLLNPEASFPPQLLVTVQNEAILPYNLMDAMAASAVVIDGKAYARQVQFGGPGGVGPQQAWSGCLPLEDYVSDLKPGRHTVMMRLGDIESNELSFRWTTRTPAGSEPATRLRQVKTFIQELPENLSRQCLEFWLTEKDGGIQALEETRYIVAPDVKVKVVYRHLLGQGAEPRLKVRPRAYIEKRVID